MSFLCLTILLSAASPRAATFNVLDYDADPSGANWSTRAIQKAIDACTGAGGGAVRFPRGRYRIAPLVLKDNVTLQFERDTFLDAPRSYREYVPFKSLIRATGARNVALRGPVVIEGHGADFWSVTANPTTWYQESQSRPSPLVQFRNCSNVVVEGITIANSPSWALSPYSCTNVTIANVTITNDYYGPNTDGIDICQSQNVLITGCRVATGDDTIAIKNLAPTAAENVTRRVVVTNCDLTTPSYALKIGTESRVGVIEDILFTDCRARANRHDLGMHAGIALQSVDGGTLRNVRVNRIQIEDARSPIFLRLGNRGTGQSLSPPVPGRIQDILIENVTATAATTQREFGVQIHGLPGTPITNLTLRNLRLISRGDVRLSHLKVAAISELAVPEKHAAYPSVEMFGWLPAFGLYARHVQGLTLQNLELLAQNSDVRPALALDDVSALTIQNVTARHPGSESRPAASLHHVTRSPGLVLTAQPHPNGPTAGWLLATP